MKAFLTFREQLDYLANEKLLVVPNMQFAEAKLQQIGYFGLIGGYKDAFKNPMTGNYRDGIHFEDIVALYEFDEDMRQLFLRYILRVERHIRTLLSHYFCERHGSSQSQYLNPANYTDSQMRRGNVGKLIRMLDGLVNASAGYSYVNHHRSKYGNVPLWVLVNGITFGALAKFYDLVEAGVRARVSKHFPCVNEKQLGQMLNVLSKFRNVCAHNERFFSYRIRNAITDMPLHAKLGIAKSGNQYIKGKRDLFAVVLVLWYLLPEADFQSFAEGTDRLIRRYLADAGAIEEHDLMDMTGFPVNWGEIMRCKR
jgi:abortive infection bacteriophage resistance protein